jgi:hypothetical protein
MNPNFNINDDAIKEPRAWKKVLLMAFWKTGQSHP